MAGSFSIKDVTSQARVRVSKSLEALKITNPFSYEMANSNVFDSSYDYGAIVKSATANFVIRGHGVTTYLKIAATSGGTCSVKFFQGNTMSGAGTTITPYNRDLTSGATRSTGVSTFEQGVFTSYGGGGTTKWQGIIPAGERVNLSGNQDPAMWDWTLPAGTTFAFSVRNATGATQKISIHAMWFEK